MINNNELWVIERMKICVNYMSELQNSYAFSKDNEMQADAFTHLMNALEYMIRTDASALSRAQGGKNKC